MFKDDSFCSLALCLMKQSKQPIPHASKCLFIFNNQAVQYASTFKHRGRKTLATLLITLCLIPLRQSLTPFFFKFRLVDQPAPAILLSQCPYNTGVTDTHGDAQLFTPSEGSELRSS